MLPDPASKNNFNKNFPFPGNCEIIKLLQFPFFFARLKEGRLFRQKQKKNHEKRNEGTLDPV